VEGDKRAQIIGECGSDRWPVVTRGTPSAAGDALFVRGEDYLYCVGERR
jgi:hypothetical protein